MTIISDHVLNTAEATLQQLERRRPARTRPLPSALDDRVIAQDEPRSDYERWLRTRVVCSFCREDYKPDELFARINLPGSQLGKIICASCISEIGFTGCEWFIQSRTFASHVINIFGTDEPPEDWDYLKPRWREVAAALEEGPEIWVPTPRATSPE